MTGLGTIVNAAAVIGGGVLGLLFGNALKERFREILMQVLGVSVIFIGISGALSGMFTVVDGKISTSGTMIMVISLAVGALIGEAIGIERHLENLGRWLESKAKGAKNGDFVTGFVASSLTICVGAMAIVGPLEDALSHNCTMLFTKAILDGVIVMIFASAYGIGAVFSALPLIAIQGTVTLFAGALRPILTDAIISNLSFVGSVMIFCIGINLAFSKKLRVANMLPALIITVIMTLLPFNF